MSAGALVLGLLNGLTIGLLAVGLVLVYKSNRFLNLAHAQMGALSALLLAKWVIDWEWSYAVAFPLAVAVAGATGLVLDRFIVGPVRRRTTSSMRLLLLSSGSPSCCGPSPSSLRSGRTARARPCSPNRSTPTCASGA